jgi:hypothetical protein
VNGDDENNIFRGYLMDERGRYRDPIILRGTETAAAWAAGHCVAAHEVRLVDADDALVMHFVRGELLFPRPEAAPPR